MKISSDLTRVCPIRNVLSRIGDKWSLLVLVTLDAHGICRFGEIHKELCDISHRMLTVTLRSLEEDGLVARKVYPEVPPKVEYSLTERGKSLLPHINDLVNWALDNMEGIEKERRKTAGE